MRALNRLGDLVVLTFYFFFFHFISSLHFTPFFFLTKDYHLDSATDNEADLFRRTTLHQCLDQEPRRSRFYPLSETGGVYCPNQAVFRRGYDRNNEFMDRFEWISVVVSVSSIITKKEYSPSSS